MACQISTVETARYEAMAERLAVDLDGGVLAVGVGDAETLAFEQVYLREGAGAEWADGLFSPEIQSEIFESVATENFFDIGEDDLRSPMGDLQFTDRIYEHAIVVVGWEDTETVVVTIERDVDDIPPTVRALEEIL